MRSTLKRSAGVAVLLLVGLWVASPVAVAGGRHVAVAPMAALAPLAQVGEAAPEPKGEKEEGEEGDDDDVPRWVNPVGIAILVATAAGFTLHGIAMGVRRRRATSR